MDFLTVFQLPGRGPHPSVLTSGGDIMSHLMTLRGYYEVVRITLVLSIYKEDNYPLILSFKS